MSVMFSYLLTQSLKTHSSAISTKFLWPSLHANVNSNASWNVISHEMDTRDNLKTPLIGNFV